jgi:hypothetical protein
MGADISMPEASFCERFSNLSKDFLNEISKDQTDNDEKSNNNCALLETETKPHCAVKENEKKLLVLGEWIVQTEMTHTKIIYNEITFRKNGFVYRIYFKNKINNCDIFKCLTNLKISTDSLAGLYKPPMSLNGTNMEFDDEVKPEFFEIKNGKICDNYYNCDAKKFYLIFKKDEICESSVKNNNEEEKKILSSPIFKKDKTSESSVKNNNEEEKKILSSPINKKSVHFLDEENIIFFNSENAIIDTSSVGNNIENNCGLDSVDEGIIIGENDNVDSNSYFSKLSDIGTLKIVVNELSIEDKQEIARLEQCIRDNPRKTKNCKTWRQEIANIRSKY